MSITARLALGVWLASLWAAVPVHGQGVAASREFNPLAHRPVRIGPEAARVIVGFKATTANAAVKSIKFARQREVHVLEARTTDADAAALLTRTKTAASGTRQLTPSMHVVALQQTLYGADVEALLTRLRSDPAVAFADVDERRYAHALPDDPLFSPAAGTSSGQWFMLTPSTATPASDAAATDAVSAWNITTGSSGTVIADVDSGIRFDHPDLLRAGFGGRLLPGYDFVGNDFARTSPYANLGTFLIANDGDGYDPDPSDPGDWIDASDQQNALFPASDCPVENSSWHGTRVVGILGALTNNGVGVAGMTWNPYILPVRALGKCGGYDQDIITAIEWSVGMSVSGVPDNPYPADIVNLSLGGVTTCGTDYQSLFDTLNTMGVLVVASAGNESGPVDSPANCNGVLAVAGLRNIGTKVGYSSLGPEVGVAAPAGNCVNASGPCLRSLDTTVNSGLTVPGANTYTDQTTYNLGTSFSAPIVVGVAALMRAVNANLTPAQLISRIEGSASPFPQPPGIPVCPATDPTTNTGECACTTSTCGAGMVNAFSAVKSALRPIAAIAALPAGFTSGSASLDASASSAACGAQVAGYLWSASDGVQIVSGANAALVHIMTSTSAGSLTLTVTDSAGATDSAVVQFTSTGGTTTAPTSAGTSATACPATLTVTPMAPTLAVAFTPTSVAVNTAASMAFTLTNGNGFDLTQSGFTNAVPAGLAIAVTPAATTTCTGSAAAVISTSSSVSLSNAIIPANGSCSVTLSVKSAAAGTYADTVAAGDLTTGPAGSNSAASTSSLTVTAPASHGGGGDLDWLDMMFVAGVLLAGRRARAPRQQGQRN